MNQQTAELKDSLVLHKPELHAFERDGIRIFVDGESPNWISTDTRGAKLLEWIDGKRDLGEVRRLYAALYDLDWGRSWRDVDVFAREAVRKGIVFPEAIRPRSDPWKIDFSSRNQTFPCFYHLPYVILSVRGRAAW